MTDTFDPNVSLRTLRAAIDNYDGRSAELPLTRTALLIMMVDVFNALDVHLSSGGNPPTEWCKENATQWKSL